MMKNFLDFSARDSVYCIVPVLMNIFCVLSFVLCCFFLFVFSNVVGTIDRYKLYFNEIDF